MYFSLCSGDTRDVFLHEDAVYGLAADPRDDNIYASACADGRVLLWDTRVSSHQGKSLHVDSHYNCPCQMSFEW